MENVESSASLNIGRICCIYTTNPAAPMPKKHTLEKANYLIRDFFESQDVRSFSLSELRQILDMHRDGWGLARSLTFSKFMYFLLEEAILREETCSFPARAYTRFTVGEISPYEFLLSLIPNAYFSHHTALSIHQLTEKVPDKIYLNFPQARKLRKNSSLDQNLIDRAFQRSPRISKNASEFRGHQVLLLNSMGHEDLGIIQIAGPEGAQVRITDLERTLIDIVVRPVYSGGISNVLESYSRAKGKVSISKMVETLTELDFAYPYHQSIGFCLQRCGFVDSEIAVFRKLPMKYDFYLDYQMGETEYSEEWQLYFPKDLS